ncbi:hypothetical protein J3Q64DRAFT_1765190 [Phycomyces blakesleeanus]|uniref:Uncharacterized protein n=2 Tax=Phycomyces blakesleeanus TaxID=4837 RepID=A0A167N1W6_PHYB8|nr:hypothetical protein PHYBLDRAFT_144124 [Phycomyces blakesleeanus NRRL 1555(-)]OAD74759.1 hypothetical protein PHYBLDRAFT_144124 [Phycomyces blakesleeanus NRRL 1555(-)]|eukprot:XP_018292799.1 hypothetical protein PHYBLDRAFT_144124 [Phycomyces blakesleeanus NRRL 1555(-)]
MDLSWCIICDNRVEDNMSEQSSLYCSAACRVNDQSSQQQQQQQQHQMFSTSPTTTAALSLSSLSLSSRSQPLKSSSTTTSNNIKNTIFTNRSILKPSKTTTAASAAAALQLLRNKRAPSSNAYPWVPLYRRRHGVLVARRCQPVVAGSPVVASAHFNARPSMVL